jgi:hypothetical protein
MVLPWNYNNIINVYILLMCFCPEQPWFSVPWRSFGAAPSIKNHLFERLFKRLPKITLAQKYPFPLVLKK